MPVPTLSTSHHFTANILCTALIHALEYSVGSGKDYITRWTGSPDCCENAGTF